MKGYQISSHTSFDFQVDQKKRFNRFFLEQMVNDQI